MNPNSRRRFQLWGLASVILGFLHCPTVIWAADSCSASTIISLREDVLGIRTCYISSSWSLGDRVGRASARVDPGVLQAQASMYNGSTMHHSKAIADSRVDVFIGVPGVPEGTPLWATVSVDIFSQIEIPDGFGSEQALVLANGTAPSDGLVTTTLYANQTNARASANTSHRTRLTRSQPPALAPPGFNPCRPRSRTAPCPMVPQF